MENVPRIEAMNQMVRNQTVAMESLDRSETVVMESLPRTPLHHRCSLYLLLVILSN
jgi:hypothetical protein